MARPALRRYYLKARLAQATIHAALAGVGAFRQEWPVPPVDQPLPLEALRAEISAWLRTALSQVRTPHGVDTCAIVVKLIARPDGQWRRQWSQQLPSFRRAAPEQGYADLARVLQTLLRADYPDATALEISLISLGDIVAFRDNR